MRGVWAKIQKKGGDSDAKARILGEISEIRSNARPPKNALNSEIWSKFQCEGEEAGWEFRNKFQIPTRKRGVWAKIQKRGRNSNAKARSLGKFRNKVDTPTRKCGFGAKIQE